MRNEITQQEIDEFKRRNPGASVADYINRRIEKLKHTFGDSQPTTRTFYDVAQKDLADIAPKEESASRATDDHVPTLSELADKEL